MKEYLNGESLFASLTMLLAELPPRSLIFVPEGSDDALLLKRHVAGGFQVLPGEGGRPNVLRAAELAAAQEIDRVRFLIDRDFDSEGDLIKGLRNLYVSQSHDFFTDLALSDQVALESVVGVALRSARRRPSRGKSYREIPNDSTIISGAVALTIPLTAVRMADRNLGLGTDFTKFSYSQTPASRVQIVDVLNVLVARKALDPALRGPLEGEAIRVAEEIKERGLEVAGDHDFFAALAHILRLYNVNHRASDLQGKFILAVRCSGISQLRWFGKIQAWFETYGASGLDCAA